MARRGSRGKASIVRQVSECMKEVDKIGISKRDTRKLGDRSGIHSVKHMREVLSASQNFAKWVRENHGVRRLEQLRIEHYQAYMSAKQEQGVSKGHLINIETALKKLQVAFQKQSERRDKPIVTFVPEERVVATSSRESPQNRSYTRAEVEQLARHMSPEVQKAMDLSLHLGLRAREAVNIRVEHVIKDEVGRLHIKIEDGKGITKGGRYRDIPVPSSFEQKLSQMIQDKRLEDRICSISTSALRKSLDRACDKAKIESRGWHGFRHQFAREQLARLVAERGERVQRVFDRMLENASKGKKLDARIRTKDKGMNSPYREAKSIIDQVHGWLGHGQNRTELVAVYMAK